MRATIVVSVDQPDEVAAAEAWFARWREHLTYCSENNGCGCCVEIWDVDGPEEAIAELPNELKATSDWTEPDIPQSGPSRSLFRAQIGRRKRSGGE